MDRLASMAAYVKAVEAGSFVGAATTLGISSQMVAKHVGYLETRLGTRLLNRTTRRQGMTEIGRTFYDRCKLVLADADWADSLAEEAKGVPRGRLHVNAPVSFGAESLMPVVTCYLREHPGVEVDLVLSDRFVDLVEDEFEAVFRTGPLTDSNLEACELTPFRLVACASPAYLRARGTPREPADLQHHECLGQAHWSQPANYPWRFARGGQRYEPQLRSQLRVNDAKALLTAATDGFGIVLIAEDLVRQGLAAGHLLFRPDRRQTPKLRSFIDAIVRAFPPDRPIAPAEPSK